MSFVAYKSTGLTLQDVVELEKTRLEKRGYEPVISHAVTLCGGPAWFLQFRAYNGELYESQVLAANATAVYLVGYYHATPTEVPAAYSALMSLCIPKDPLVLAGAAPLTPPPGWGEFNVADLLAKRSDYKIWAWHEPFKNDTPSLISVLSFSARADEDVGDIAVDDLVGFYVKKAQRVSSKPMTLCNNSKAILTTYKGRYRNENTIVEAVSTVQQSTGFLALYFRPADRPLDPAASHALQTLCAPGSDQVGFQT